MDFTAHKRTNGEEIIYSMQDPKPEFFSFMDKTELTDEKIDSLIDNMNISADAKALLKVFSKSTFKAGKSIIRIGKKIIDIIYVLLQQFPYLTFGAIFGLLVGALISAIPLIGVVLGTLATKIAIAFGVALGAREELNTGNLKERIDAIIKEFAPLQSESVGS